MLHFRKHPVTSLLTMTEYLPALIINGPMRVSIMVLLVGVMPGWEGTRQPEDGQCTLGIIPLTWMTLWVYPLVRFSSCLTMELVPDSPAPWMIISLMMMVMEIMNCLTVIEQCDVMSKWFFIFSSAHFGRTLESTLSVMVVMLWWPLLNWDICLNIFFLIVQIFL